jgi:hypothetical protein
MLDKILYVVGRNVGPLQSLFTLLINTHNNKFHPLLMQCFLIPNILNTFIDLRIKFYISCLKIFESM